MMTRHLFRRCGHAPGSITPEDQAVVDAFRAPLAALRSPEPWTPGCGQDVAVRVGPFVERAHPRPGDDHGPDQITVALVHPDTPRAEAYLEGRQLGYDSKGWLRCETTTILGLWSPAYTMLTHAAAGLVLPDDVAMTPARYGVHVDARREDGTGYTILCLGPYPQVWLASPDVDRLSSLLAGRAATAVPGYTLTVKAAPLDVGAPHGSYHNPYDIDLAVLLDAAIEGAST